MTRLLIILAAVMLLSCKHFRLMHDLPSDIDSVHIDESFRLYTRTVYRKRSDQKPDARLQTNQNIDNRDMIEINYLLYSPSRGEMIYITTIPDPQQTYYTRRVQKDGVLNIRRFSRFHIGKIDPTDHSRMSFQNTSTRQKNVWVFNTIADSIHVIRIIQMVSRKGQHDVFEYDSEVSVDNALASRVMFAPHGNFRIEFPLYDNNGEASLVGNTFYFTKGGRARLLLKVDKPVRGSKTVVCFGAKRVRFPPATAP